MSGPTAAAPVRPTGSGGVLRAVAVDRAFRAILLGAVLTGGLGALRRQRIFGMDPNAYDVMRSRWRRCADMVLGGDSRVWVGVSPAAMREVLPDRRILNFAFAGTGYTQEYLARLPSLLDPASTTRAIVLGMSPTNLSAEACKRNMFLQTEQDVEAMTWLDLHCPRIVRLFRPMQVDDIIFGLFPNRQHRRFFFHHHPDGWVASRMFPEDHDETLKHYAGMFRHRRVTPGVVERTLGFIRRWHGSGIRVYACRIPTTRDMVALEAGSLYDEDALRAAVRRAGGTWIDVDQRAYRTYDANHLYPEAALEFSRDLARKIRQAEAAETAAGPAAPRAAPPPLR